jgi:hypothetical protein
MRLSRWITFPLLLGFLMVVPALIFLNDSNLVDLLVRFVTGAGMGFAFQAWSDHRTRKRAGSEDLGEDSYAARRSGSVTVFGDRESVLDLCVQAVEELGNARLKRVDRENGEITARTKMNWDSLGTMITIRVNEIGDSLAEVTINTRPIPRTAAIDYGVGLEIVQRLTRFLTKHDRNVDTNLLRDGAEILVGATTRPLSEHFARRMTDSSD